jgi:dTDP-4-dehydrorhamnose 3,5-epimerase
MSSQHSQILEAASLKDGQFVTPEGKPCRRMIEGVRIRDLVLHTDDRGTVCEMFDPRWGWHPDPLVFTYFYTIRPGLIKGWAMHKNHEDRYCIMQGEIGWFSMIRGQILQLLVWSLSTTSLSITGSC